jgi:hypothetical protein
MINEIDIKKLSKEILVDKYISLYEDNKLLKKEMDYLKETNKNLQLTVNSYEIKLIRLQTHIGDSEKNIEKEFKQDYDIKYLNKIKLLII